MPGSLVMLLGAAGPAILRLVLDHRLTQALGRQAIERAGTGTLGYAADVITAIRAAPRDVPAGRTYGEACRRLPAVEAQP